MRLAIRLVRAATVALAVSALACGKDATAPRVSTGSSFTATVSGAFTGTIVGETTAGLVNNRTGGTAFEIFLSNGPLSTSTDGVIFARLGARPTTGSYSLADIVTLDANGNPVDPGTKFFGIFFSRFVDTDRNTVDFGSTTGTLTISQISSTRIRGSFDMQMKSDTTVSGTPGAPPLGVRVVGSFEGPADVIPSFQRATAARASALTRSR